MNGRDFSNFPLHHLHRVHTSTSGLFVWGAAAVCGSEENQTKLSQNLYIRADVEELGCFKM